MRETNIQEIWEVDINGDLFEADMDVLAQWITEGTMMPTDRVRRGKLRWIEARKVPALIPFFNAFDQGLPAPSVKLSTNTAAAPPVTQNTSFQTTNSAANSLQTSNFQNQSTDSQILPPTQNFVPPTEQFIPPTVNFQTPGFDHHPVMEPPLQDSCIIHAGEPPKFFCETCLNVFCRECPKGFGGNVRICPMCGSMCKSIGIKQAEREKTLQYQRDMADGFNFGDFGKAWAYPFKFKVSLIFGAILYMLFSIGQLAAGSGSFMMFSAVLICFMLANMISFSVLANTVENFSQGKITRNFMPDFDEFSLWDDVVQPFFLNVGVYIVSFGLLTVVLCGSVWLVWGDVKTKLKAESDKRMEAVNQKKQDAIKASPQKWESDRDRAYREDVERMNKTQQFNNILSLGVMDPEADLTFVETISIALKSSGFLVLPIILAWLWGIFYYPIACTVAGYSRSFSATVNPSVGIEAIKILGGDYAKILLMSLILTLALGMIEFVLNYILGSFNIPGVGNIPAVAISSLCKFYFYTVFAVILGYALYKNAHKFNFRLD